MGFICKLHKHCNVYTKIILNIYFYIYIIILQIFDDSAFNMIDNKL